jgi:parvulin-like peptidyl-prolyl isomerase
MYPPAVPPPATAQFAQREARRPTSPREQTLSGGADTAADPTAAEFEGAKAVATVGNEVILASEAASGFNELAAANADKIPPGQLEAFRRQYMQERLKSAIEAKLLVVDARRKVPEANMPKILEHLGEEFEKNALNQLEHRANVETRAELDAKLREQGSSLERFKRNWIEQQLAGGWLHQQVKTETKHVTHEDMLKYYYDHLADYDFPAKARWEQLMVRLDKEQSHDAARTKLAQMGNDVMRGAKLAEVARAHSEGPTASDGGQFDWTSRGSLASSVLDEAIFALPVGRLSQILEDDRGLYIVRVTERTGAGRKSFSDMQGEIKKAIEKSREDSKIDEQKEYLARLRREIPVWTIFDDPAQGAAGWGNTGRGNAEQTAYQGPADSSGQRPAQVGEPARSDPPDRYGHREPATPPKPVRR